MVTTCKYGVWVHLSLLLPACLSGIFCLFRCIVQASVNVCGTNRHSRQTYTECVTIWQLVEKMRDKNVFAGCKREWSQTATAGRVLKNVKLKLAAIRPLHMGSKDRANSLKHKHTKFSLNKLQLRCPAQIWRHFSMDARQKQNIFEKFYPIKVSHIHLKDMFNNPFTAISYKFTYIYLQLFFCVCPHFSLTAAN